MAKIEFRNAVAKLYFDAGRTEDGKMIRKTKSYGNVAHEVTADNLFNAITQLASLSEYPVFGAEKVDTSDIMN